MLLLLTGLVISLSAAAAAAAAAAEPSITSRDLFLITHCWSGGAFNMSIAGLLPFSRYENDIFSISLSFVCLAVPTEIL